MPYIYRHLIGGLLFVVGIILLIVGIATDGGFLTTIGTILAIAGPAIIVANIIKGLKSLNSATSELSFGAKGPRRRGNLNEHDSIDFDGGDGD